MKAHELDKKFDDNEEDVTKHFTVEARTKRVNVDFPIKVLQDLDAEAEKRGVTRQSLLKLWIYEKIQSELAG